MPTITVTNADHRNHAMARDISTGYTFTRTPGSSAFIEGVATTLKKYSSPIQMIPKIKCSHRNAINSFAAPPGKLKCGFHSGNVASSHRHMRKPPLQIIDVNLQIEPSAFIVKRSWAKLRRPHVAFRVVRRPHALARDADKIPVQLAIRVFVVHHGHGVYPRGDSGEVADRLALRNLCGQPGHRLVSFRRERIRRRK